jgi:PAS domain S-box-containing protein
MDPNKAEIEELRKKLKELKRDYTLLENAREADLREQRLTEKALKKSEVHFRELSNQFEAILDHIPGLVFYKDRKNNFIRVNKYLADAQHKRKDEMEGVNLADIYPPGVAEQYYQDDLEVIDSAKAKLNIIEPWETKEGMRWVSTSKIPFINAGGEILGVIGISLDITEMVNAQKLVQLSEKRLLNIIASNYDGMLVVDLEGKVRMVNPAALKLFNRTEKEMLGHVIGIPINSTETNEIDLIHPDGQLCSVALGVSEIEWINYPAYLVSLRDITDRKKAEQEILKKNETLKLINTEKDKLFSIVAHDLKGPFSSFLGFTQLMAEELPTLSLEQLQKIAGSMRKSATNLYNLLENLLEWSCLQRGATNFTPKPYPLHKKITESILILADSASNKNIAVKIEIPESVLVFTDEVMFASTMRNLVSNAIKFTQPGGEVFISANPAGDNMVEVSVSDTGIGMGDEVLQNLFDLEKNTNRKGTEGELSTGLGLIITKEFIEKQGGKLKIESTVNQGSKFSFTLPEGMNHETVTA